MTAEELEKWLATAESKSVGQKHGNQESTGRQRPSDRRHPACQPLRSRRGRLRAHA
nr:DUF3140 domain-containing protein [Mycobacterium sherrisii]